MAPIGIIGAGIGGLHLALFLQKNGVEATLYAERTPDEQRESRLPNTAIHWAPTRAREHELGVDYWEDQAKKWEHIHYYVGFEPEPLKYRTDLELPGACIDHRMYLARLLEEFAARGGEVVYGTVRMETLEELSERHDLMVVSAGRGSMVELFPRREDVPMYPEPQRFLCTGIYDGIEHPQPTGGSINAYPAHGELFHVPFLTFEGNKSVLFFEIVPGGVLDPLMTVRYDEDPDRFEAAVLDVLERAFPETRARVDDSAFGLSRRQDVLQGAITPTARRGYAQLSNGRWVMALGDVHVLNDPITAQGANSASAAAFLLGEAILEDDLDFDELWCTRAEARMWDYHQHSFRVNHRMLALPLPFNVMKLILASGHSQGVADAFGGSFANPRRQWSLMATDARTDAFLARHGVDVDSLPLPELPVDAQAASAPGR